MYRVIGRLAAAVITSLLLIPFSQAARAQPVQSYTIFSEVSMAAPGGPLAMGANFPSGSSTGLVQTVNYDPKSLDQVWTVLPIQNGVSVILHRSSGLALRFGAYNTQLTLAPFVPYDPSFLVTFNPIHGYENQILSVANSSYLAGVAGDNIYPLTPVAVYTDAQKQGQRWLLLPLAE